MLYHLYEMQHALLTPVRLQAELTRTLFQNPLNPLSYTQFGRTVGASAEMIERVTKRFGRPEFGLHETEIAGKKIEIVEKVIARKPFCSLLNFHRKTKRNDPKVLLVAPMSGHYATLLRGTVEALLPHHDVYITDWEDARQVPGKQGRFNLDDYITYLREFLSLLGPDVHAIAVCQPAVPTLAAVSLMATENDPNQPLTMTLMGGPVDTRVSKTAVTELAETRPLRWFESTVVHEVPFYYPGAYRRVYPGFLQLGGFMSMNLDRHVGSYMKFYHHLIIGDGESAEHHRTFYNEYLSVMDIPAEFYLQTVETVFQRQLLPRGRMKWRDPYTDQLMDVRPQDIEHTALLTIEGELDDISARGQTTAAHELCYSLSQRKQFHHFQLKTGHYGIFNGRRWRNDIMPRIRHHIRQFDEGKDPVPAEDLAVIPDLAAEKYNRETHGIAAIRRWIKENQPQNYKEAQIQQKGAGWHLEKEKN
ncbi:MAG: polyhydroxyalkanoate depolymerase [Alphaproteobacteria bacterium]|nr:polyhydroxyalkanoate depolymerase [Alphaproteobacteria bacterium]MBP7763437.1 polyhydroxyalkanoate depolymerase [Alphaproteobacteria bacterium]MBP7905621.1 polyhydroxyalkanoate depolymerase [Alphaproteobacteria bacterium]